MQVQGQIDDDEMELILRRTLCIVPMHNEEAVIESVVRDLLQYIPTVICIDDGSTDASGYKAARSGARVFRHVINLGQGAAIRTGIELAIRNADVDYIVTFDADGQHLGSDARAMLEHLVKNDLQIVFGSRFTGAGRDSTPLRKRLTLSFIVLLRNLIQRVPLTDAHNGLRVMTLDAARAINLRQGGMAHASEFVRQARIQRLRIGEYPVTIRYTEYSMSKGQTLLNGINILFELILGRR